MLKTTMLKKKPIIIESKKDFLEFGSPIQNLPAIINPVVEENLPVKQNEAVSKEKHEYFGPPYYIIMIFGGSLLSVLPLYISGCKGNLLSTYTLLAIVVTDFILAIKSYVDALLKTKKSEEQLELNKWGVLFLSLTIILIPSICFAFLGNINAKIYSFIFGLVDLFFFLMMFLSFFGYKEEDVVDSEKDSSDKEYVQYMLDNGKSERDGYIYMQLKDEFLVYKVNDEEDGGITMNLYRKGRWWNKTLKKKENYSIKRQHEQYVLFKHVLSSDDCIPLTIEQAYRDFRKTNFD